MIEEIFKEFQLDQAELSIVLCGDQLITDLNKKYLKREGSTNVISFPMQDAPLSELRETPNVILGDVVVNVKRALDDAREAGVSPLSEVAFLTIHGICHLLGFDHEGEQGHMAPKMEKVEKELFDKYFNFLIEANQ